MRNSTFRTTLTSIAATLLMFLSGSVTYAQNAGWGTIKGRIVWDEDQIPVPAAFASVKGHKDQEFCEKDGPVVNEEWVISKKTKGIRWVFVWLAPQRGGNKLAIHPSLVKIKEKQVALDQPCCAFVPHALALREGQDLIVRNSAKVVHNVRWHSLVNGGDNQALHPRGEWKALGLKADKMPFPVQCDLHPWMSARVCVFNHPYFAVTDENGSFELKLAPAGKYKLKIHHDTGWRGGKDGAQGIDVEIPAESEKDLGNLGMHKSE